MFGYFPTSGSSEIVKKIYFQGQNRFEHHQHLAILLKKDMGGWQDVIRFDRRLLLRKASTIYFRYDYKNIKNSIHSNGIKF